MMQVGGTSSAHTFAVCKEYEAVGDHTTSRFPCILWVSKPICARTHMRRPGRAEGGVSAVWPEPCGCKGSACLATLRQRGLLCTAGKERVHVRQKGVWPCLGLGLWSAVDKGAMECQGQ